MSVATGTLGDEVPGRCHPSPSAGSGQAPPRGLSRSAPNRRASSRPLRTAVVLSVRIGAPGEGTMALCHDGA